MRRFTGIACLSLSIALSACTSLADLTEMGHPPRMTQTSDPTQAPDYRPITMPMPPLQPPPTEVGSLWRSGSRAFFKDQRASQVGDLITINVNISDNAAVNDNTTVAGSGSQTFGIPSFFGAQGKVLSSSSALDTSSASANTGAGIIRRNEIVTLALAGTITQVLPNGNFVIVARQEVRVNGELRQLMVSGVVRPQDITEGNIVTHDRIAEARISYGGRGQLTKAQTARYGQQIMDGVLPF